MLLLQKDNSGARQTWIKTHFKNIRISKYITPENSGAAALSIAWKWILSFSRQVPQFNKGNAHHIKFLLAAVIGNGCAKDVLTQIPVKKQTFQELCAELEAAVQDDCRNKVSAVKDQMEVKNDITYMIHYALQCHTRRPRHFKPSRFTKYILFQEQLQIISYQKLFSPWKFYSCSYQSYSWTKLQSRA